MSFFSPFNPRLEDWQGKTAWIVGASSGIGLATAKALLARGARVAVSARNGDALDALAAEHPDGRVIALPLDVTDMAALDAAHAKLAMQGPIDLLVHCAGYYKALRATEYDRDVMLAHQQVNYVGAINLLEAALPAMRQRGGGHLSLVASVAGFRGLPQSLGYGPTKAALTNMAEVLYTDLHALGIGVSVIQPGFVKTGLTDQNEFEMPALITPEEAASAMLEGWASGAFEIHFPKRFTWVMKTLRVLPYRLYFPLVNRFTGL